MAQLFTGFKCPQCREICNSRTSRSVTSETVERYYTCKNPECRHSFKTLHALSRFICRPVAANTITVQASEIATSWPVPDKTASHTMRLE